MSDSELMKIKQRLSKFSGVHTILTNYINNVLVTYLVQNSWYPHVGYQIIE